MTATIALPRQPHSDWLARIRTVGLALGGRGVMGLGLGRSSVGAAEASWWLEGGVAAANAVAVYQPKGAASLAASYVNLANPGTYNAAPGVAPPWDAATGWKFAGASSQYLTTGIVPSEGWTAIGRFTGRTNGSWLIGSYIPAGAFALAVEFYGPLGIMYGNRDLRNQATSAIYTGAVIAIAGPNLYLNGSYVNAVSGYTYSATSRDLYIASNNGWGGYLTGNIQAVAVYNTTLSADQVAAVSAAMAAL